MPRFSSREIHQTPFPVEFHSDPSEQNSSTWLSPVNIATVSNMPADLVQPPLLRWQCVLRSFRQHITSGQITISSHDGRICVLSGEMASRLSYLPYEKSGVNRSRHCVRLGPWGTCYHYRELS